MNKQKTLFVSAALFALASLFVWVGCGNSDSNPTGNRGGTTVYTLSLSANPAACAAFITGAGSYNGGANATISVTAAPNCTFTGWSPTAGIANPSAIGTVVSMTQNRTVTANFTQGGTNPTTHTLTVNTSGNGFGNVTRSVGGSITTATSFNAGTVVTLTAQANIGSTFTGWSGSGCSGTGSCVVTMTQNMTVTASFTQGEPCAGLILALPGSFCCQAQPTFNGCDITNPTTHALTINASGNGSGSVTRSVGDSTTTATSFNAGTTVTLTAQANAGSTFGGWSGGGCSGTGNCVVTMTQNTVVTADFTQATYTLTVNTAGTGSGNVTRRIVGNTTTATSFNAGTVVTLTAQPNTGSTFGGWAGGGCNGTGNCVVTMTQDVTVTANFITNIPCVGGRFTDTRDGREYRCVTIGTQTWMAENLNYAGSGGNVGVCHAGWEPNCNTYGRLYDWVTAMGLPSTCNSNNCWFQVQSRHPGICPTGWHVPSDAEWTTLTDFVGSPPGIKLKSTTGWTSAGLGGPVPGTDEFGFSAQAGGSLNASGSIWRPVRDDGFWWSATESSAFSTTGVWGRVMWWDSGGVRRDAYGKSFWFSLRCVMTE
jgi:uncharacterized protein (TIGR02145 family)